MSSSSLRLSLSLSYFSRFSAYMLCPVLCLPVHTHVRTQALAAKIQQTHACKSIAAGSLLVHSSIRVEKEEKEEEEEEGLRPLSCYGKLTYGPILLLLVLY